MLRDYAAAKRGLAEGEALAPKLHVLRGSVGGVPDAARRPDLQQIHHGLIALH